MGYLTYSDADESYIRVGRKQYLPYITYQSMGGTLDETTFDDFEYEAETIVDWYTFNRLKDEETYPDELEYCMYKLIEYVKLKADTLILGSGGNSNTQTSAAIASQSNDGVSISYNTVSASELFNKLTSLGRDNPLAQIVFRYLQGVKNSEGKKLTYRGLYPDE